MPQQIPAQPDRHRARAALGHLLGRPGQRRSNGDDDRQPAEPASDIGRPLPADDHVAEDPGDQHRLDHHHDGRQRHRARPRRPAACALRTRTASAAGRVVSPDQCHRTPRQSADTRIERKSRPGRVVRRHRASAASGATPRRARRFSGTSSRVLVPDDDSGESSDGSDDDSGQQSGDSDDISAPVGTNRPPLRRSPRTIRSAADRASGGLCPPSGSRSGRPRSPEDTQSPRRRCPRRSTVLIADPLTVTRTGLSAVLTASGIGRVIEADTVQAVEDDHRQRHRRSPRVGQPRASATRRYRLIHHLCEAPWQRVIALAPTVDPDPLIAAVQAGASGVLRGRPGTPDEVPGQVHQLTAREIEVLSMVADGRSNKWIAEQSGAVRADREEPPGPDQSQARNRRSIPPGRHRHARRGHRLKNCRQPVRRAVRNAETHGLLTRFSRHLSCMSGTSRSKAPPVA